MVVGPEMKILINIIFALIGAITCLCCFIVLSLKRDIEKLEDKQIADVGKLFEKIDKLSDKFDMVPCKVDKR